MVNKLRIAAGGILALGLSTANADTLQDVVQYTIDNNPEIHAAKAERQAVEQEISQAKAGFFPTVDIAVGSGWERSHNSTTEAAGDGSVNMGRDEASIEIRQMIYDGFATSSEVKRQTFRTNSRAYTVFGQAEITALDAVEAYLNVLRREELLKLAQENLEIHKSTSEQISSRSERGVGRKSDVSQSSGRLALAERNVLSEAGNLRDAQSNYLRIVGKLPHELVDAPIPGDALPASFDQAVTDAITNHPILKGANEDIESAFAQHATAKTAFMPRIDLEVSATHNHHLDGVRGLNEDASAMIRLRYNLFNGGRDMARRKETAHLINQAKSIRDNTHRQAVESMRLSWNAHETVKHQLAFFEGHKNASINSYDAYKKQFNIGRRSLLDLLDSANEMFTAKSAHTNAKYDSIYSQYRILASAGALNQHLGVQLPDEVQVLPEVKSWIGYDQKPQVPPTYSNQPVAEVAETSEVAEAAEVVEVVEKRIPCEDGINGAGFQTGCKPK